MRDSSRQMCGRFFVIIAAEIKPNVLFGATNLFQIIVILVLSSICVLLRFFFFLLLKCWRIIENKAIKCVLVNTENIFIKWFFFGWYKIQTKLDYNWFDSLFCFGDNFRKRKFIYSKTRLKLFSTVLMCVWLYTEHDEVRFSLKIFNKKFIRRNKKMLFWWTCGSNLFKFFVLCDDRQPQYTVAAGFNLYILHCMYACCIKNMTFKESTINSLFKLVRSNSFIFAWSPLVPRCKISNEKKCPSVCHHNDFFPQKVWMGLLFLDLYSQSLV